MDDQVKSEKKLKLKPAVDAKANLKYYMKNMDRTVLKKKNQLEALAYLFRSRV